jgi:hypothetical protein
MLELFSQKGFFSWTCATARIHLAAERGIAPRRVMQNGEKPRLATKSARKKEGQERWASNGSTVKYHDSNEGSIRLPPLFSVARSALPDQLRQRPVIADEVMRPAREVGELRGGDIDAQTLIERGEDVAEMNRPGARLLAPAAC